jgi:hypothetical protein
MTGVDLAVNLGKGGARLQFKIALQRASLESASLALRRLHSLLGKRNSKKGIKSHPLYSSSLYALLQQ